MEDTGRIAALAGSEVDCKSPRKDPAVEEGSRGRARRDNKDLERRTEGQVEEVRRIEGEALEVRRSFRTGHVAIDRTAAVEGAEGSRRIGAGRGREEGERRREGRK